MTVWRVFGGVSLCCVWDSSVWIWGSKLILCVLQVGEGLGSECVLCVGKFDVCFVGVRFCSVW